MSGLPPRRPGAGGAEPRRSAPAKNGNKTIWIVLAIVGGVGLVCLVMCAGLVALLLPAVQQARTAARNTQFKNNLKQVGLSAHNFHDTNSIFPPAPADGSADPNVTSPISFHTSVLPFLEQGRMYESIDKTIAWDDPANSGAYQVPLEVFLSPIFETRQSASGLGGTHLVPNSQLIGDERISFRDISDGTSNTIMAGGIDDSTVPAWGDPDNGRDPANGFGGGANAFGGAPNGGAQVLFCDGSVQMINPDIAPEVAKALASPAGGEPVGAY